MGKRDYSIDILRALALAGMIVAHCRPGALVMQLRGFDVPLIVFLSGVSYVISSRKNQETRGYLSYCWKRFKRLAFPAWIFLIMFYAILFTGLSIKGNLVIHWEEVIGNFTFVTDWYTWIIRIFLVMALCAPFLYGCSKRLGPEFFPPVFAGVLLAYELLARLTDNKVYYYITMNIPYLMMFLYGVMTPRLSGKRIRLVAGLFFVVFVALAVYYYSTTGAFQITQIRKYPPRLYYTSFAITVTSVLWILRNRILKLCDSIRITSVLSFIGSHTLWIYFWHIIFLMLLEGRIGNHFVLFACVFPLAVAADYIQVRIVESVIGKLDNETTCKNLRLLFLG